MLNKLEDNSLAIKLLADKYPSIIKNYNTGFETSFVYLASNIKHLISKDNLEAFASEEALFFCEKFSKGKLYSIYVPLDDDINKHIENIKDLADKGYIVGHYFSMVDTLLREKSISNLQAPYENRVLFSEAVIKKETFSFEDSGLEMEKNTTERFKKKYPNATVCTSSIDTAEEKYEILDLYCKWADWKLNRKSQDGYGVGDFQQFIHALNLALEYPDLVKVIRLRESDKGKLISVCLSSRVNSATWSRSYAKNLPDYNGAYLIAWANTINNFSGTNVYLENDGIDGKNDSKSVMTKETYTSKLSMASDEKLFYNFSKEGTKYNKNWQDNHKEGNSVFNG